MLDYSQILIIAAITIMTVILTVIGVQIIFILKDVRQIIHRINAIGDKVEEIGLNVRSGTAEIVGFVVGVRKLLTVIEHIASETKSKKKSKKS